ncbi:peptidoglycan-associated lipoprotein Pal [Pseudosulfitobacter sp. DSM 107133]|jgi:peptidoglycan-associated lipoprotein|uniref:peptidoglycan-associated lipoprotein Pal n=1 Tax=Pseudosulfitobacter sp. DSM 107133 TaxID=2883100 RepID=UPI000DF2171E|nr:peptidoglycan-associated lipoprotein Pal [Pseudosulfitobacter sp. DSM 107133]UOA26634.1 Outer membrane lipoprotein Omp16 [Pseudosulfitobacter sp. DSM 107133]
MKFSTKIVMLAGVLALAACTNPDRFGADGGANGIGNGTVGGMVPGSASDPTSVAYFQQSVGDRVLFQVDQSTLTAEGRATLDGQAAWLSQNGDYTAIIEGHADEQGTREYNLALGARRADAARAYLISQGVPAGRLRTISYGKERPIEVCSNEACYAKNRRAVTVLAGGLTG